MERRDDVGPIAGVALAVLVAGALLTVTLDRVIRRLAFPYDLVLWADDYLITSLMKLGAGQPVYGPVADANSSVYAPGGAWLHYAVLRPLSLETSVPANKILVLLWLAVAITLATRAALDLLGRSPTKLEAALVALFLTLAAFANPTADTLHPMALDTLACSAAALALGRWPLLAARTRVVALVALPAAGLLAKQTGGVAIAMALAVVAGATERRRVLALVPLGSLAATSVALTVGTGGAFKVWCFDLLLAHPYDWWKASDLYAGYGLLFLPVGAAALVGVVDASRRRDESARAWLRVFALVLAYAPLALAALFKRLGGPNNLAALGFLTALVAAPVLVNGALAEKRWLRPVALVFFLGQLALFYPRRRVPDGRDYENAETACSYAASRMRCGESVLVGRGAVCYARASAPPPRDRVVSAMDVWAAGRRDELGLLGRLERVEYDLLVMPIDDLAWFGQPLWRVFEDRYKPFFMTGADVMVGDLWFDGWQGIPTRPMVYFERVRDAGRHEVSAAGADCARR